MHVLADRRFGSDRQTRRRTRNIQGYSVTPQSPWPTFGRRACSVWGIMGEFSANLFDGGSHQCCHGTIAFLGGGIMSRLIVVSNRVPDPDRPPLGGLAVAIHAALEERGGVWMGWSGKSSGEKEPGPLTTREEGRISYALTDLSDRDLSEYYEGLANS